MMKHLLNFIKVITINAVPVLLVLASFKLVITENTNWVWYLLASFLAHIVSAGAVGATTENKDM